jgi:hypothetical protein
LERANKFLVSHAPFVNSDLSQRHLAVAQGILGQLTGIPMPKLANEVRAAEVLEALGLRRASSISRSFARLRLSVVCSWTLTAIRRVPGDQEFAPEHLDPDVAAYLRSSAALLDLPIHRLHRMNPFSIELYKHYELDDPLEVRDQLPAHERRNRV